LSETNQIVQITDTRWGRNDSATIYDDFEPMEYSNLVKRLVDGRILVSNFFNGNVSKEYSIIGTRKFNGLYCFFRDTPAANMGTVLNIKTNEEMIYNVPVQYRNTRLFIDTDGTLMTRDNDKLVNLSDPTQPPIQIKSDLLWNGIFSKKYIFKFDSSKNYFEIFDRRTHRRVDIVRTNIEHREMEGVSLYTEETIRFGNFFYNVNSNKKNQLAELKNFLPLDVVKHIGTFILL
jgi:hypothetical protein